MFFYNYMFLSRCGNILNTIMWWTSPHACLRTLYHTQSWCYHLLAGNLWDAPNTCFFWALHKSTGLLLPLSQLQIQNRHVITKINQVKGIVRLPSTVPHPYSYAQAECGAKGIGCLTATQSTKNIQNVQKHRAHLKRWILFGVAINLQQFNDLVPAGTLLDKYLIQSLMKRPELSLKYVQKRWTDFHVMFKMCSVPCFLRSNVEKHLVMLKTEKENFMGPHPKLNGVYSGPRATLYPSFV